MSAKRVEYHPLMGALNQTKSPPMRRAFVSAKRVEYHPLMGALNQTKCPPMRRAFVSAKRVELLTNGLKGHCSAIELRAHY